MHKAYTLYWAYPLLLVIIGHSPQVSIGQSISPVFYEIVQEDSALLFSMNGRSFQKKNALILCDTPGWTIQDTSMDTLRTEAMKTF